MQGTPELGCIGTPGNACGGVEVTVILERMRVLVATTVLVEATSVVDGLATHGDHGRYPGAIDTHGIRAPARTCHC